MPLKGGARVAGRLSHDSQPVGEDFPLWTESGIPFGRFLADPGHWGIPAFALGRCMIFPQTFPLVTYVVDIGQ
jgi:hypothetical protein